MLVHSKCLTRSTSIVALTHSTKNAVKAPSARKSNVPRRYRSNSVLILPDRAALVGLHAETDQVGETALWCLTHPSMRTVQSWCKVSEFNVLTMQSTTHPSAPRSRRPLLAPEHWQPIRPSHES